MKLADLEKCAGKVHLCKRFRKSEVVFTGSISEIRNIFGFGFWFGDSGFWAVERGVDKWYMGRVLLGVWVVEKYLLI